MIKAYLVGGCTGNALGCSPPQNSVGIARGFAELNDYIGTIRDQAAAVSEISVCINSR